MMNMKNFIKEHKYNLLFFGLGMILGIMILPIEAQSGIGFPVALFPSYAIVGVAIMLGTMLDSSPKAAFTPIAKSTGSPLQISVQSAKEQWD